MDSKMKEFDDCINDLQKRIDLLHVFTKHLNVKEHILLHYGNVLKRILEKASFEDIQFASTLTLPYDFYSKEFNLKNCEEYLNKGVMIKINVFGRSYICESAQDKRYPNIVQKVEKKMNNIVTEFYKKTGVKLTYNAQANAYWFTRSAQDDHKDQLIQLHFYANPKDFERYER